MINGGYILQPRIIDGSESSNFPPVTRELWGYLLRNVNHARNDRLNIDRGQGFFRLADIQEDLKWYSGYRKNVYSKPQLTKSLRRLREGNMVETTKETRGLLITICNYDYYQDPKNYEGNDEETTKGSRRKSKGHTINKNEKEQEEQEEKKKTYGHFENVLLTDKELLALKEKFNGSCKEKIEALSEYLKSKGKRYKSHYATILTWDRKDKKDGANGKGKQSTAGVGFTEAGRGGKKNYLEGL